MDRFLLDIRSGDPETCRVVTSADLEPTLRFGLQFFDRGNRMWVPFVLVPGLTDAPDSVEAVAAFTATLSRVERVEVLPLHQLGAAKWAEFGLAYQLSDVTPPSTEQVERVESRLRSYGLKRRHLTR